MSPKTIIIKETFTVAPNQGAAMFCAGLSKPGYRVTSMIRNDTKVVVTFTKEGK